MSRSAVLLRSIQFKTRTIPYSRPLPYTLLESHRTSRVYCDFRGQHRRGEDPIAFASTISPERTIATARERADRMELHELVRAPVIVAACQFLSRKKMDLLIGKAGRRIDGRQLPYLPAE